MSFLQNRDICFNQDSLSVTYCISITEFWSDAKVRLITILTYKLQGYFFLQRDQMYLEDHEEK